GFDEDVFQVNPGSSQKRRVVGKKEGEADHFASFLGQKDLGDRARAKEVLPEPRLVEDDFAGKLFVVCKGPDELGDRPRVFRSRGSNHEMRLYHRSRGRTTETCRSAALPRAHEDPNYVPSASEWSVGIARYHARDKSGRCRYVQARWTPQRIQGTAP